MKNIIYIIIGVLTLPAQILSAQEWVDGEILSPNTINTKKAANDYVSFYQKHLSAIKNAQCAMYPSCSNYGKVVLENNNLFKAIPLIADRMIRCSHDRKNYEITFEYGRASLVDCPDSEYEKRLKKPTEPLIASKIFLKDTTINFINSLINQKEYQSALLEIRRAEYYKTTNNIFDLQHAKFVCLRGLGDYEKGIYEYETLPADSLKNDIKTALEIAKMYYLIGNFQKCITTLDKELINKDNDNLHNANIIKAAANSRMGYVEETINSINIARNFSDNDYINTFNEKFIYDFKNLKLKNPTTAKILSIIPGAGYLYAGHKGSAMTAFAVNALLAYATYTSIKAENYGIVALTSFFSLSFYIGNINGAGKSAKRYNENKKNKLINNFEHTNNIFNQ